MPLGSLAQHSTHRVVLACEGRAWSGAGLRAAVASVSLLLSQGHAASSRSAPPPLSPGDRVALLGASSDAYIIGLLGLLDAGCIAVPLNTRWSAPELAHALATTTPRLMLVDAGHEELAAQAVELLQAAPPALQLACLPCGGANAHAELRAAAHAPPHHAARPSGGQLVPAPCCAAASASASPPLQLLCCPHGTAAVVFTSGTTGPPKGVSLSHASLHAQSLAKLACVGYARNDVYLHLAPLFHVGGLSSLLANLAAGAAQVVLPK
jgi:acyl-activating enzyme 14